MDADRVLPPAPPPQRSSRYQRNSAQAVAAVLPAAGGDRPQDALRYRLAQSRHSRHQTEPGAVPGSAASRCGQGADIEQNCADDLAGMIRSCEASIESAGNLCEMNANRGGPNEAGIPAAGTLHTSACFGNIGCRP